MARVFLYSFYADEQDAGDVERAWETLDDDERRRARRFVHDGDRRTFVIAHGLLRMAIALHSGLAAEALRFFASSRGKPTLSQPADARSLQFNLSHTPGLVCCAIARGVDVGVDVEVTRTPAPEEIADRHFSPAEMAWLRAVGPEARADRFYTLWTLKEAYVKARGTGLVEDMGGFSVSPTSDGRAELVPFEGEDAAGWTLRHRRLRHHRLALALRAPEDEVGLLVQGQRRIADLKPPS